LYYYEKQTPKEIAKAILSVNFNDNYDSRRKILSLYKTFNTNLEKLLI